MARPAKKKTKAKAKVTKEVSAAIKTFKATSEVENFYRFIHENNLRLETETLLKVVLKSLSGSKKKRRVLQ